MIYTMYAKSIRRGTVSQTTNFDSEMDRAMGHAGPRVILYPPQLHAMAQSLASALEGDTVAQCTDDVLASAGGTPAGSAMLCWDKFPGNSSEKDPNTKVLTEAVAGKHVVLLLSQDDTSTAFSQLSLLLWLQRFYVPRASAEHAKRKWKQTVPDGAFDVFSVASLTVVIPWYRYCQMERSCRWSLNAQAAKPWDNSDASGAWVDIAAAHTYAALLSADPPPPPGSSTPEVPPLPPKEILFIDMHDDLNGLPVIETTLSKVRGLRSPSRPCASSQPSRMRGPCAAHAHAQTAPLADGRLVGAHRRLASGPIRQSHMISSRVRQPRPATCQPTPPGHLPANPTRPPASQPRLATCQPTPPSHLPAAHVQGRARLSLAYARESRTARMRAAIGRGASARARAPALSLSLGWC